MIRNRQRHPVSIFHCSGGAQQSALLWHPRGDPNRAVGELSGHVNGVLGVEVDPTPGSNGNKVITLAGDGVVAVWDLRTFCVLQRIGPDDYISHEDAGPGAVAVVHDTPSTSTHHDTSSLLLTGNRRPSLWSRIDNATGSGGTRCSRQRDAKHSENEMLREGSDGDVPENQIDWMEGRATVEVEAGGEKCNSTVHSHSHVLRSAWRRPYSRLHLHFL